MCHGEADSVVQFSYGKQSFDVLRSCCIQGEFKSYPFMDHSSCEEEVRGSYFVVFLFTTTHNIARNFLMPCVDIYAFLDKILKESSSL